MKVEEKQILYVDMDGVIADFDKTVKELCPEINLADSADYEIRSKLVDEVCKKRPHLFHYLDPIEGGIESVKFLMNYYDVYFLTTPMWAIPESFAGKRIWLDTYFGENAEKRLILTHRKDLAIGHFLVDDRTRNGAGEFGGELIQFGTPRFPDWKAVTKYLINRYNDLH